MGQFATPTELARQIIEYAKAKLNNTQTVQFMDPAIGTGSFFSALINVFPEDSVKRAVGYEVDPHYGIPAANLWSDTSLEVRIQDFTAITHPPDGERFNLLVCNPPYVRHHHIDTSEKPRLKARVKQVSGHQHERSSGTLLLFLGLVTPMDGAWWIGWMVDSERIHGCQLWHCNKAIPT